MEETAEVKSLLTEVEIGESQPIVKYRTPLEEAELLKGRINQAEKMIMFAKSKITFFKSLKHYGDQQLKANQKTTIESFEKLEKANTYELNNLYSEFQELQLKAKEETNENK